VVLENNLAATESAARSPSGYGPPQITERSRKDFDSPATDGDGCPQHTNIFSDGLEKLWEEGAIAGSVRGPTNWVSLIRKHREVLNISLDPPETKRILLKTKNFVNACLRRWPEMI